MFPSGSFYIFNRAEQKARIQDRYLALESRVCYLGDFGDNLAWWVQCRLWNQIVLCDLGKGLYLSWPQFSPLQNGNTNSNELGSVKICQVPWPLLLCILFILSWW